MSGLVPDQRLVPYDESQQQAIQAFQNLQVHQAQALQAQDQADLSSFGPRVEVSSNNTEFKTQHVEITFDTHCWIRTTTHELFCVTAGTDLKNNKTPFAKLSAMLSPFRPDWMVFKCGASQFRNHITHYMHNLNTISQVGNGKFRVVGEEEVLQLKSLHERSFLDCCGFQGLCGSIMIFLAEDHALKILAAAHIPKQTTIVLHGSTNRCAVVFPLHSIRLLKRRGRNVLEASMVEAIFGDGFCWNQVVEVA